MKLHADSLTRTYGTLHALDGLTLSLEAGVLVLIGPSGGGKSTFLRLCGGLDQACSGTLEINDTPLGHDPARLLEWRRRNGFLFQQFNLFPHLTALRNITLPLEKVHGQSPPTAMETARRCLDRFGLLDHADKLPARDLALETLVEVLEGQREQSAPISSAVITVPVTNYWNPFGPTTFGSVANPNRLANLVNWTIYRFDPAHVPAGFKPYTPEEIGRLRQNPLRLERAATRARLVAGFAKTHSD